MQLGGAGNRNDPRLLRQQPRQGHLGGRRPLGLCDGAQGIYQRLVCLPSLGAETRNHAAEVVLAEVRAVVDGSREKALAQRAERHKADAQLLQGGQDGLFRFAPPQGVFALHCGHRLHGMGPPDGLRTRLRQAEMQHLALSDQVLHGARHILNGHLGVHTVLVQQINHIGAQALERALDRLADVLRPAVENLLLAVVAKGETELGRDDDLVAHGGQGLAEQVLVEEWAIDLSGVKEGHPPLHRCTNECDGLAAVRGWAITVAQPHAAQAQGRDLQARPAQFALVEHVVLVALIHGHPPKVCGRRTRPACQWRRPHTGEPSTSRCGWPPRW